MTAVNLTAEGDELADAVEQWFDKPTKENENVMEDALGRYRESGG